MKAKWDAEKEAKKLLQEEEKRADQKLENLKGPITYMIIGIVCMICAITAMIKIILCGKGRDFSFQTYLYSEVYIDKN